MFYGWLSWFEALNGRLIGPKTWDQIVGIFGALMDSPWRCMDCLGCLCCDLCIKSCFDVYEAGIGHGFRVHKVEPMLDD